MFKIDLYSQIQRLEKEKSRILEAYLKNGRTEEEFYKNYKDRFYPTYVYDKKNNLITEGWFDENKVVRIR